MADVRLRHLLTVGQKPLYALQRGHIVINEADGKIFTRKLDGTWREFDLAAVYALAADLAAKLDKAGGVLSGGLNFGGAVATSVTNLSRHLALYDTSYGLNVTAGTLNIVAGAGTGIVDVQADALRREGYTVWDSSLFDPNAKLDKIGGTITGALQVNGQTLFGGGHSRLTHNDGGGNFNIRIGHYFDGTSHILTEPGSAVHIIASHDNIANAVLAFRVFAENVSKSAGQTVSAYKELAFSGDGGIFWAGQPVWHGGNFNPAAYAALSGAIFTGTVLATGVYAKTAGAVGQSGLIAGSATTPGYTEYRDKDNVRWGFLGWADGNNLLLNTENGHGLEINSAGDLDIATVGAARINGNVAWHAGNFNPAAKLDKVGGALSGGLSFGSATVASATDLSRHLALFSTNYGISITPGALNIVANETGTVDVRAGALRRMGQTVWDASNFDPDSKLSTSQRGAAGGVAPLNASGKVDSVYLPADGAYKGAWNAATNSPTITSSTGINGDFYIVTVAGSTSINGTTSWAVGDQIRFNGSIWQRVPNTNAVSSVANRTGAVVLAKADVGLANVDNTSDASKPVSTATQAALSGKQDALAAISILELNTALAGSAFTAVDFHTSAGADYDTRLGRLAGANGNFFLEHVGTGSIDFNGGSALRRNNQDVWWEGNAPAKVQVLGDGRYKLRDDGQGGRAADITHFGAAENGSTTANNVALQAAANAMMAFGTKMIVPAGTFPVSQKVTIDISARTDDRIADRWGIEGFGSGVSVLMASQGGTDVPLFEVLGGTNAALHHFAYMRGLKIARDVNTIRTQRGLFINNGAYLLFEDFFVEGFAVGMVLRDVLSTTFMHAGVRWNVEGISAYREDVSNPNAVEFQSAFIQNNQKLGLYANGGASIGFTGTRLENNGWGTGAGRHGLWIDEPGNEGGAALRVNGGYFEGNGGGADVHITMAGNGQPATCLFEGVPFRRILSNQYVVNNIYASQPSGAGKLRICVAACAFEHAGSYAPSAARKYIQVDSNNSDYLVDVDAGTTYMATAEKPVYARLTPIARFRVDITPSNGTFSVYYAIGGRRPTPVVRNGVGDYWLYLASAEQEVRKTVTVNTNRPLFCKTLDQTADGVRFLMQDNNGNPFDPEFFSALVYDF